MRSPARPPIWISEDAPPIFPDPREFDRRGLIAGGGDLSPERMIAAYRAGIFPWYDEPPILWWSPSPRAVISHRTLHVSRSLRRTLRKTRFSVTLNRDLKGIMDGCSDRPEGTWLTPDMKAAYFALQRRGHIVSYEVWDESILVGGLFGVIVDGLFAAESMYHRRTDASKIALVCAVTDLFDRGVHLFDVQFLTEHLITMGALTISRNTYLTTVRQALGRAISAPSSEANILPHVRRLLALS